MIEKGKSTLAAAVTLELTEGRCVQVLHVGPYAEEKVSIGKMNALAEDNGVHLRGPHHGIYLSDPNRVPPERLRTILRYPVKWEESRAKTVPGQQSRCGWPYGCRKISQLTTDDKIPFPPYFRTMPLVTEGSSLGASPFQVVGIGRRHRESAGKIPICCGTRTSQVRRVSGFFVTPARPTLAA